MATGDGLLARLTPAGSTIAFDAFAGLCAAARTHGNGIVEITSRGSIQIRGLSAASAPLFAADVASLGIEASDGIPVVTDPLAGLGRHDRFDANALAAEMRKVVAAAPFAARLSAKVSVVVDGGGELHLDALAADIRLRAIGGAHVHIALAGDAAAATPLGAVPLDRAVECVIRLFETLVAKAPQSRMRNAIEGEGLNAFKSAVADLIVDCPAPDPSSRRRSGRHSSAFIKWQRVRRRPAVRAFGFGSLVELDGRRRSGRRSRCANRAGPRIAVAGCVTRG